jgi:uncharacterized RDD family membrane protein YckC
MMKESSTGLVLGPLLLRAGAYLIDVAILVFLILMASGGGLVKFDDQGAPADTTSLVVLLVLGASYHIGFVAMRSATPGKMILNIYVAYPDGSAVRPDTAILRYLVTLAENFLLIGAIISIVLMLIDRDRRTIHDRVAGTLVLAGRAGAPLRIADLPAREERRPLDEPRDYEEPARDPEAESEAETERQADEERPRT